MKRTLILLSALTLSALGLTFAACSSDDSGGGTGNPDSGETGDSGTAPSLDSGAGNDATTANDSGTPASDSGKPATDSGKVLDSGEVGDSGKVVDSGTPIDSGNPVDSGTPVDSGNPLDSGAPVDSGPASDSAAPADSGGNQDASDSGCVNLTVDNVKVWCSISVGGAATSTAASQTVCVAPGTVVSLVATPAPPTTFELGPWHNTAGDLDAGGEPGSPPGTTSITVDEDQCVWICCPFSGGSGCIQDPSSKCAYPGH